MRILLTSAGGTGKITGGSDLMGIGSGVPDGGAMYGCGDQRAQQIQQYIPRNVRHGRGAGVGQSRMGNGLGAGITACGGRRSTQAHQWRNKLWKCLEEVSSQFDEVLNIDLRVSRQYKKTE